MTDYKFTQDWFHWAPEVWQQLIPMLPERKKFLEIGSFEGRSTVWIVENMMEDNGEIYCIDTWSGGEEHSELDMSEVEERFNHNRQVLMDKFAHRHITRGKGTSVEQLAEWLRPSVVPAQIFDFIYIDGSHIAKDVLTDACMAWPLLKTGGIMVFDDYMWGNPRDILHRPKAAIDAFTTLFAEELEIIHVGYQAVVRKKGVV
jgi:predicted O-methyltransferase YrrM